MNPKRIYIFHITNGDTVIVFIADNFVFDFFPATEPFFDQDLRCIRKCLSGTIKKLFFIAADTTAQAAQSVSNTQHHRITDLLGKGLGFFNRAHCLAFGIANIDLIQRTIELLAIFRIADGLNGCTQNAYTMFF